MSEFSFSQNMPQPGPASKATLATVPRATRPAAAETPTAAPTSFTRQPPVSPFVAADAGAASFPRELQHCDSCPYRTQGRRDIRWGRYTAAAAANRSESPSPYGVLLQRENEKWIHRQPPNDTAPSKAAAGGKPKPQPQICPEQRCRLWSDLRLWFGYGKTDLSEVDYCAAFLPIDKGGIGLYEKLVQLGRKTLETFAEHYLFHQFTLYTESAATAADGEGRKVAAATAGRTAACRLGRGAFPPPPPLPEDLRQRVQPVTPQLLFVEKHVERVTSHIALFLFGSCYLAAAQDGRSTREKIVNLVLASTGFSCCAACGPDDEEDLDDADAAAAPEIAAAAPPQPTAKTKTANGGAGRNRVKGREGERDEGPWMTIKGRTAAAAERLNKRIAAASVKFANAAFAASAQAHLWLATLVEHCYWCQRISTGRTEEESALLQDLHDYMGYEEGTLSPEIEDCLTREVGDVKHGAAAAEGTEILRVYALEYLAKDAFPPRVAAASPPIGQTPARQEEKAQAAAAAEASAWAAEEWQRLRQSSVLELFACTYLSLYPFLAEDSREADEPVEAALLRILSPPAGYEVEAVHVREDSQAAAVLQQGHQSAEASAALLLPPSNVFVATFLAILSVCWRTQPEEKAKIWMHALVKRIRQLQVTQDLVLLDEVQRAEGKNMKKRKDNKGSGQLSKLITLRGLQRMRLQYAGGSNLLRKYLLWQQAETLAALSSDQQQQEDRERLIPTAEALALFPIAQEMERLREKEERRWQQQQREGEAAAGPGDLVITTARPRLQQYQRSSICSYSEAARARRFPPTAGGRIKMRPPHMWKLVDPQGDLKYELLLVGGPYAHPLGLQDHIQQRNHHKAR